MGSEFDLLLSTQDLITPTRLNVRAEDIQPRSVRIRLDEVVRRTLVVEPRVTITPDSGFALQGGIAVEPGSVTVTGPEAVLRGLRAIPTVPLEVSGVNVAVRRQVPLDTTGLGAARVTPAQVEVSADVAFMAERVLMGVPVTIRAERPATFVADPPAVLVTVRGPSLRLARLTRDSVLVFAVPTTDGPELAVLEVVPPEGLTAVATPDTATVTRRPRG
jgi:YbbR domain-containing protein